MPSPHISDADRKAILQERKHALLVKFSRREARKVRHKDPPADVIAERTKLGDKCKQKASHA